MAFPVRIETESRESALAKHSAWSKAVSLETIAIEQRFRREPVTQKLLDDLHTNDFNRVEVLCDGMPRKRELVVGSRRISLPPVRTY